MEDLTDTPFDMMEVQSHLSELCQLLEKWKWLALTRPTHIIVDGVLESHSDVIGPISSLPVEVHVAVLSGFIETPLPEPLREFHDMAHKHLLKVRSVKEGDGVPATLHKKTSAKKQHETSRLSRLVAAMCSSRSLKSIVDVGSGLGYVDRELCRVVEDCEVLAVESEEARCTSADAVNKMLGLGERIKQCSIKLQGSNLTEVRDALTDSLTGPCCLIALHACGDLTPTALRLFKEMPLIDCAVILSCCYHKMSFMSGSFPNFPVSCYLKKMLTSGSIDSTLVDVSLLRLAAESTKEMWAARGAEQLSLHARSVAYRALVELYGHKNGVKFVKTKRVAVKPSSRKSWEAYVVCWTANTHASRLSDGRTVEKNDLLRDLLNFYSEGDVDELVQKALAFNTLKTCIQLLTELLVLEDRLLAMVEAGFTQSSLVQVADSSISPRCIALVVSRP